MLKNAIKHFLIIVFFTLLLLWPQKSFAIEPPTLISPSDNSTIDKSPKLIWEYSGECVQSGSCFRIEVDNSSDFSSAEKSTYTNNSYYSPQGLTEGTWNWRVKGKDNSQKWSEWSKVYKFTVTSQTAPASSSPIPQTTQTPQPSTTPPKTENAFNIKELPGEVNSNQEFEVSVFLKLPDKSNSGFYLKGAFKKDGSSNYYGETLVGGDWIGNSEKYSKQFKITSDSSGNWEGKIKVKPDQDDSGFEGTGNYIFKVARYTDSGSGPIWSNELSLKINAVSTPTPSSSSDTQAEIAEEEREEEEVDLTASLVKTPDRNYEIKIASVAGQATISNNIPLEEQTRVLNERKVNWSLIILGVGILGGGVGFTYLKFKKEKQSAKSYN